jgi:uncharacterized protein YyaL (SSP411 family)
METGLKAAAENPFGFGQLLNAIYLYISKPLEITIIRKENKEQSDSKQMSSWLGNSITALVKDQSQLNELSKYPFFNGKKEEDIIQKENINSEYAFVCRNFSCSLPINSLQQLQKYLGKDDAEISLQ